MAALHDWKVAAALVFVSTIALAQEAPSRPAGYRLGDAAAPTGYDVRLAIDPKEATFAGEAKVSFHVKAPTRVVWLHATRLLIESVEVTQGGRRLDVDVLAHGTDYLGLRPRDPGFAAGDAVATFRYTGAIEQVSYRGLFRLQSRGESYVVTQHEEISARRTFPCFDEPGWKAPFRVTVDAPAANVVASSAPELRAADLAERPGWRRHEFAPTKPLPTYLVGVAVGPFDVVDGGTAGRNRTPLRYLAPKGRGAETRYAREVTPRLLEILEEYFGTPFPFEKMDSVTLPEAFTFGAMENVGLVTYGEQLLLAHPQSETPRHRRNYASTAAHEIAHMWFGNLVTPAWWDDIWLNEAFATWVGEKALYKLRPEWDNGDYRARSRALAVSLDRLDSARRVRNPVNSTEDMEGNFDSISYDKGGAVLEMFEAWIGETRFRDGVREYLRRHEWGVATSSDFFRAIGKASGRGPEAIAAFESFVDQSGVPLIDVELACDRSGARLEIARQRFRPKGSKAAGREWITPACFRAPVAVPCETLTAAKPAIALPSCPAWLLGNARGAGYYVTRYGRALWARNLKAATTLPALEATTLVSDSALLAESGLVPPGAALDVADAALRHRAPVVQLAAVRLLAALPDPWLDAAQLRRKRAVITQRVQPLAKQLGWREKPKEAEEVADLRVVLMPFAARSEGGAVLRREAHDLAVAWMRDRASVAPSMVIPVLETAARFADRGTYELLESLAVTATDGLERRRLQSALAKVREPGLRARALGLTVQKRAGTDTMNGRDSRNLLADALQDEHNRAAAFEFLRTNFDAIAAKVSARAPGQFPVYLKSLCTPRERDTFVAFFRDRSPRYEGGRRRYDEALEAIELCIAARA